jgi:hypothetical protein
MNKVMMRIQCLELSTELKMKFSALKLTQEAIAETLANFAIEAGDDGIEPRMAALQIAVHKASRRSEPLDILTSARQIVEFADPPPSKPKPAAPKKVQPRKSKGYQRKTSR